MTKFHINSKGVPAPCQALKGNCPFGGESNHFSSKEEAQEAADEANRKTHGLLPTTNDGSLISKDKLNELDNKEVDLTLKNGERVVGIVSLPDTESMSFHIADKYNNYFEIYSDEIESFTESRYRYYSKEYDADLRKRGIPRLTFRYTKEEAEGYSGKYVDFRLHKDNEVCGLVKDVVFNDSNNISFIVEDFDTGEIVELKNKDFKEVLNHGSDKWGFLTWRKYVEHSDNFLDMADEITEGEDIEVPFSSLSPTSKLNEYMDAHLEAVQNKTEVNSADPKFTPDWVEEYKLTIGEYEPYSEDVSNAEEINKFYNSRKKLIDKMVQEIKNTDWTKYGKTQEEGEVDAIRFFRENNDVYC